jgi:hypothetical protein
MTDRPRNPYGDFDALGEGMDSSGQSELAAVGRAVRAVYVEDPAPEVAEAHIAAILAEAERVTAAGADLTGVAPARPRRPRGRGVLAIRLAAVVASAFVASAGLAIAGVRPPEPFSDVLEGLGFDVPGSDYQSRDADVAGVVGEPGSVPAAAETRGAGTSGATSYTRANADSGSAGTDERSATDSAISSDGEKTAGETQPGDAPTSEANQGEDGPHAAAADTESGNAEPDDGGGHGNSASEEAQEPLSGPATGPVPQPTVRSTDAPGYTATSPGQGGTSPAHGGVPPGDQVAADGAPQEPVVPVVPADAEPTD